MAKKPLAQVIAELKAKHAEDGYDYSLITEGNYIDTHHKVPIICPRHGVFWQSPHTHLKEGCKACGYERLGKIKAGKIGKRKGLRGFGVFDVSIPHSDVRIAIPYKLWASMIRRCYDSKWQKESYLDCYVCEEWKYFSNFLVWFNNHKDEYRTHYHLDKDILSKGNKEYSPQTCCFVPPFINTIIIRGQAKRANKNGHCPIGVTFDGDKYTSRLGVRGKVVTLGRFDTMEEAFQVYKVAKEKYLKDVAQEYYQKGEISQRVFNALMFYRVDITD